MTAIENNYCQLCDHAFVVAFIDATKNLAWGWVIDEALSMSKSWFHFLKSINLPF